MKQLFLFFALLITVTASAQQEGSFHRLHHPVRLGYMITSKVKDSMYVRWTALLPGTQFDFKTGSVQVVTGIGYGAQWQHFDYVKDAYITDYSLVAVAIAGGLNVTPSINPNNILALGIAGGWKNFYLGPVYNFLGKVIQAFLVYTITLN